MSNAYVTRQRDVCGVVYNTRRAFSCHSMRGMRREIGDEAILMFKHALVDTVITGCRARVSKAKDG